MDFWDLTKEEEKIFMSDVCLGLGRNRWGIRIENSLKNAQIQSVMTLISKTSSDLLEVPGIGKTSLQIIERALSSVGLKLGMTLRDIEVLKTIRGLKRSKWCCCQIQFTSIKSLNRHLSKDVHCYSRVMQSPCRCKNNSPIPELFKNLKPHSNGEHNDLATPLLEKAGFWRI